MRPCTSEEFKTLARNLKVNVIGHVNPYSNALLQAAELKATALECYKVIVGLLTDDQLDFRQPDGYTGRERIAKWHATLNPPE